MNKPALPKHYSEFEKCVRAHGVDPQPGFFVPMIGDRVFMIVDVRLKNGSKVHIYCVPFEWFRSTNQPFFEEFVTPIYLVHAANGDINNAQKELLRIISSTLGKIDSWR